MAIHAYADGHHRGRVERGEVVQPAPKNGVHLPCEVTQFRGGAPMHPPGRCLTAHISQLVLGSRREEAGESLPLYVVVSLPRTKRVPTKRERHLVIVLAPPTVLAVHDPRIVGMQLQPDIGE